MPKIPRLVAGIFENKRGWGTDKINVTYMNMATLKMPKEIKR